MRVSCGELEARLEELIAGDLDSRRRAACEEHLATCERCAGLVELASVPLPAADAAGDPTLVAAVLELTSGPTCERAHEVLLSRLDGESTAAEDRMLAPHLAHCPTCRALERSLAALARDLPRMAELAPGGRFVERVMAASLPLVLRLRRWRRGSWPAWVRRPRFAFEIAYALTAVLVILFNIPGTPLAAMPRQAVELVRTSPLEALEEPVREGLTAWSGSAVNRRLAEGWTAGKQQMRTFFEQAASWMENAREDSSSDQGKETEESI